MLRKMSKLMSTLFGVFMVSILLAPVATAGGCGRSVPSGSPVREWALNCQGENTVVRANWDRDWDNLYSNVHLTVNTGCIPGANGEKCVQIGFDWAESFDHYDTRIVRVCKSFAHRDNGAFQEDYEFMAGAKHFSGMRRLTFSLYDTSSGTTGNRHDIYADNTCEGSFDAEMGSNSARIWKRNTDGSSPHSSGGYPWLSNS